MLWLVAGREGGGAGGGGAGARGRRHLLVRRPVPAVQEVPGAVLAAHAGGAHAGYVPTL